MSLTNSQLSSSQNGIPDEIDVFLLEIHINEQDTELATIVLDKKEENFTHDFKKIYSKVASSGNDEYTITIYAFKLTLKDNPKLEKKTCKVKCYLKVKDLDFPCEVVVSFYPKDVFSDFVFDAKFEKARKGFAKIYKNPPKVKAVTALEKFSHYRICLKDMKVTFENPLFADFVKVTIDKFLLGGASYDLQFFITVFNEAIHTKHFMTILRIFNTGKIVKGVAEFNKKAILNNLKYFYNRPEKYISQLTTPKQKTDGVRCFIGFYMYLLYHFDKEHLAPILQDPKNVDNIAQLLLDVPQYYKGIYVTKEIKDKIFELVPLREEKEKVLQFTFPKLKSALSYCENLLEFLEYMSKQSLLQKVKAVVAATDKPIDVSEYVKQPKETDDIGLINAALRRCIEAEAKESAYLFEFKPELWKKYVGTFTKGGLKNLLLLKETIEIVKKDGKTEYDEKEIRINLAIHKAGINLIKRGEIKNTRLIQFLTKEDPIYYNKSEKNKELTVLRGICLDEADDDFFKQWKKLNLQNIFGAKKEEEILKKILEQISDLKNFGKIFKIYDSKNLNYTLIKFFPEKFCELGPKFDEKTCATIVEDATNFFHLSYEKNFGLNCLKAIDASLPAATTAEIFVNIFKAHPNDVEANEECRKFLVTTLITGRDGDELSKTLDTAPDNCKKHLLNALSNLKIEDKDFFVKGNHSENYNYIYKFIRAGFFENKSFENTNYVREVKKVCEEMQSKIKSGKLKFSRVLSMLDPEKSLENQTFEEIKEDTFLIAIGNKKLADQLATKIIGQIKEIKPVKDGLESTRKILGRFLGTDKEDALKQISEALPKLNQGDINMSDFKKEEIQALKEIIAANKDEVEELEALSESKFFLKIHEDVHSKLKKDVASKEEAKKKFKSLANLVEENFSGIDEDVMLVLYETVKSMKDEEGFKELSFINENISMGMTDAQMKKIFRSLQIQAQMENLVKLVKGALLFIDIFKVTQKTLTDFLKYINDLTTNAEKKPNNSTVNDINAKVASYGLDIQGDYKDGQNFINVISKFGRREETIRFLKDIKVEEIENLREIIAEQDDVFINSEDIDNTQKCAKLMGELNKAAELEVTDEVFFKKFRAIVEADENKSLEVVVSSFINSYSQIKDTFTTKTDKSSLSKEKIKKIIMQSEFDVVSNKDEYILIGNYTDVIKQGQNEVKKSRSIKYDELKELNDRASLTKRPEEGDKKGKENLENAEIFRKFTAEIFKIFELITTIINSGYPEELKFKYAITNSSQTIYFNGAKTDYEKLSLELTKLRDNLSNEIFDIYQEANYTLLRLVYGKQLSFLYKSILDKSSGKINALLNFVTNNNFKREVKTFAQPAKTNNIVSNMLGTINSYLTEVLKENKTDYTKITETNSLRHKPLANVTKYTLTNREKGILAIYQYYTGSVPIAQNILYCNEETTPEEVDAFLIRAVLCPVARLFSVYKMEALNEAVKTSLVNTFTSLFEKYEKSMKSFLIFFIEQVEEDVCKKIGNTKGVIPLEVDLKEYDKLAIQEGVKVFKSNNAGCGKTHLINKLIAQSGKSKIYFPFGGVFTRKDVISRLNESLKVPENQAKKTIIHLDLQETEDKDKQKNLMKDFLFSFLITKLYGTSEDIFYLSKDIEIYIEIPSCFADYMEIFPLLKLFSSVTELSIDNLAPLDDDKNILSDLQVVSYILKYYKSGDLEKKDLVFDGINDEPFSDDPRVKTTVKVEAPLSQKECNQLIKEYISVKLEGEQEAENKYNYYQVISFIKVLADEFKFFLKNPILTASYLMTCENYEVLKGRKFAYIRTEIIKNLIKVTRHFTVNKFSRLVNSQHEAAKQLFGNSNTDEQNQNGINLLAQEDEIINFYNIDPSLMFFHDDLMSYSIICTKSKEHEEYQLLLSLENCIYQSQNCAKKMNLLMAGQNWEIPPDKEDLEDFTNQQKYSDDQFLLKLKEILDLKNDLTNRKGNLLSLREIAHDYALTADNFFKMCMILMRIRAGIPLILMGETGCGKTSLIRMLCMLKNNGQIDRNMKILNIHAGTTDKEIVDFILHGTTIKINDKDENGREIEVERKIPSVLSVAEKLAVSNPKEKLWVFLDEINTCNSMGLISELMCKNTCYGKQLPPNIVFLAACNPYRTCTKQQMQQVGLTHVSKQGKVNLVYTVNPLPHSLFNYVFNFGSLTKGDEAKYIHSIIRKSIEDSVKGRNVLNEEETIRNIKDIAEKSIVASQIFIKETYGSHAVSLREIRRFSILYSHFCEQFFKKRNIDFKSNEENDYYHNLNDTEIFKYSIILSIYICYYLRNTEKSQRESLEKILTPILGEDFLEVPKKESEFLVNNISIPQGIAKNKALLENMFTIFNAIITKVPVFVCGKPGCSKSLSVKLLLKEMIGEYAENEFFKTQPKVIHNSFQGSLGSNSEGVKKVFVKARKAIAGKSAEELKKLISMIFFDEMGLAEISPNNPLKVIHSELEYDLNSGDKSVAFVGVSNWTLDASKMNRGIFLSIAQPDEDDLIVTAMEIARS